MDAMQVQDVDYYGDSYGTYVGQVFAAFYPGRLRSIILDSAYPVRAPDAWFPTDWITGRQGLDLVCNRSPSCRSLSGTATNRLNRLLSELRQHSISGSAPDADGTPTDVTLDVSTLFLLVTNLGSSPITYRDIDSATRQWFDSHDALPLLRLAAEYNTPFVSDPVDFSYGQYQAVICGEYPLLYDLNASASKRRRQYDRSLEDARENRPDLFAPFTIDEAIEANADITPLGTCLDWPVPPPAYPQGDPLPAHPGVSDGSDTGAVRRPRLGDVPRRRQPGRRSVSQCGSSHHPEPDPCHRVLLQRRGVSAGRRRHHSLCGKHRAPLHQTAISRRHELHTGCEAVAHATPIRKNSR